QLTAGSQPQYRWIRWLMPASCSLYILAVAAIFILPQAQPPDWIATADVYARYLFLLPGFTLSTFGLWSEHRVSKRNNLHHISREYQAAAIAFGVKAFTSGVLAFPVFSVTNPLPSWATLIIQTSRMISTVIIAIMMVRILRALEQERSQQLALAVEERFKAQQETLNAQRRAHAEVEQWTRQLEDLVNSIASAMSKVTRLEDILSISLNKVLELTRFDAGDILLLEDDLTEVRLITQSGLSEEVQTCRSHFAPVAQSPGENLASEKSKIVWNLTQEPGERFRLGTKLLQEIHASGETVLAWNLLEDIDLAGSPCLQAGFCCLVNVLISCRGELLGVMNLLGRSDNHPREHEMRVLSAIGQQIGVAIENARLTEQAQSVAAIEERERLGRELHDGLAQVLGYLYLKSHSIAQMLKNDQVEAAQVELAEMEEVARETQREVREAILGLRTTITPERGILTTLTEYTRRFSQQSGITTRIFTSEDAVVDFEPFVEIQLLRIVQEALTNTRKH
ncbi:MAG: histidine kinase, partial [Anaerolineae bacterium]|nr:histidine kinase [Anaerolineae bacterium]